MFCSVIVPTYKDTRALELILKALDYQTYKDFEVIVAEDDESEDVKELLQNIEVSYQIKHYSHPDEGLRKAVAVNAAVRMSEGEYLIYIDGDTIPYSTFVDAHVALAEPETLLVGRRVNLGAKVSHDIRAGKISAFEIEKKYLRKYSYLHQDNIRHYTKGIYLKPNSLLQRIVDSDDKNLHIVASNFSCFKKNMRDINGSDESLPGGPGVDDTDVEWRMKAMGVRLKSCKYSANLLHLDHPRSDRRAQFAETKELIKRKQQNGEVVAKNGIQKMQ